MVTTYESVLPFHQQQIHCLCDYPLVQFYHSEVVPCRWDRGALFRCTATFIASIKTTSHIIVTSNQDCMSRENKKNNLKYTSNKNFIINFIRLEKVSSDTTIKHPINWLKKGGNINLFT